MPRRLVVIGLAVVAVALIARARLDLSLEDLQSTVDSAGVLGPIVYAAVLVAGLSVPFNPVSDLATVNVAALVFEPEVSVAATFVAHSVSLTVNYWFARAAGPRVLRTVTGRDRIALVERMQGAMTLRTVFVLRFALPLTAIGIDIVSYLSGTQRLRFVPFFAASIVPWTALSLLYFYSTSYLKERSLALFFLPVVALILVPSLVIAWRRRRGSRGGSGAAAPDLPPGADASASEARQPSDHERASRG